MKKIKAAIFADNVPWHNEDILKYVYGSKRLAIIHDLCDVYPLRITSKNLESQLPRMGEIEVIFSCWGMPTLSATHLEFLPELQALFYVGGAVDGFSEPLRERGVRIYTASEANAIPVAEFCLAQILLSCKRVWANSAQCRQGPWKQALMPVGRGVYGETIALIGIGAVCRQLVKFLQQFSLNVIGVSDCLSSSEARELGFDELVSLEDAFRRAYVVSNHLPDWPSTRGMLKKHHFASMRENATFINTGRGEQVDEPGMVEVLKARPDLTALLDVQAPEPPNAGSDLYTLPNVHMTSHIAGSLNDEVRRMTDFILDEFHRWRCGRAIRPSANLASLAAIN